MKTKNSSKCMYIHITADIPLKQEDIRNADITKNRRYLRSTADIHKLYAIMGKRFKWKRKYYRM